MLAAVTASSDAQAVARLSPADKAALVAVITPVGDDVITATSVVAVAQPAHVKQLLVATKTLCWEAEMQGYRKNVFGGKVFTYWQGLRWCSRSTDNGFHWATYTASVYTRGGETETPGWSWTSHGSDRPPQCEH